MAAVVSFKVVNFLESSLSTYNQPRVQGCKEGSAMDNVMYAVLLTSGLLTLGTIKRTDYHRGSLTVGGTMRLL